MQCNVNGFFVISSRQVPVESHVTGEMFAVNCPLFGRQHDFKYPSGKLPKNSSVFLNWADCQFGLQAVIFHLEKGPFQEPFFQCVTHNFYTADWQEKVYTGLTSIFMFVIPLIILVWAYLLTFWTLHRKFSIHDSRFLLVYLILSSILSCRQRSIQGPSRPKYLGWPEKTENNPRGKNEVSSNFSCHYRHVSGLLDSVLRPHDCIHFHGQVCKFRSYCIQVSFPGLEIE